MSATAPARTGHRGILDAFGSLLAAQVLAAVLGLVFWVTVARVVAADQVGVATAAISTQTLLGSVTSLGLGTLLISELPLLPAADRRRLVLRGLGLVTVASLVAGVVLALASPHLGGTLAAALGTPWGAVVFALGTGAAAAGLVVDQAGLGLGRSRVQVGRNLLASGLRFPLVGVLLLLGERGHTMLQVAWVVPLWLSVAWSMRRFRLADGVDLDAVRPRLRADLARYARAALHNHALNLALAAGSQLVPVVAALTLGATENASFAIAWLLATFVFLPPYLLATALFAHGANATAEEFRASVRVTLPAALALSGALCLGSWALGRPVLVLFGSHYADESAILLALLAPAGLWMVVKDHLVAFWRSQRRYRLGVGLTLGALALEVGGAAAGGVLHGPVGLCAGWLIGTGVEVLLFAPWVRRVLGGLAWVPPWRLLRDRPNR